MAIIKAIDFVDTLPPAPGEAPALEAAHQVLDEPLVGESVSPVEEFHARAYAATPAQSDLRRSERGRAQRNPGPPEFIIG